MFTIRRIVFASNPIDSHSYSIVYLDCTDNLCVRFSVSPSEFKPHLNSAFEFAISDPQDTISYGTTLFLNWM